MSILDLEYPKNSEDLQACLCKKWSVASYILDETCSEDACRIRVCGNLEAGKPDSPGHSVVGAKFSASASAFLPSVKAACIKARQLSHAG